MPSSTDNRWESGLEALSSQLGICVGFPRATVAMELVREELAAPEGGE